MYEQTTHPLCQSCGMPMKAAADFGTNADQTQNREYCSNCYQQGAFTQPDVTMTQMIQGCVGIMVQYGVPEEEAKNQLATLIPTLKRWYTQY